MELGVKCPTGHPYGDQLPSLEGPESTAARPPGEAHPKLTAHCQGAPRSCPHPLHSADAGPLETW